MVVSLPFREIRSIKILTNSEVKEILEKLSTQYELKQIQESVLEHAREFSKLDSKKSSELVKILSEKFNLKPETAVQIVNIMPESEAELRAIIAVERRAMLSSQLNEILQLLKSYSE